VRHETLAFLRSLRPEQRRRAAFPFDDPGRLDWHYVPRPRPGLALRDMEEPQRVAARSLLRAALSDGGYRKVTDIMRLEEVLRAIEMAGWLRRDQDNYAWSVFGDPQSDARWGWRVEGHHLSLHFTFAGDSALAFTPSFLGANPARVASGPLAGLRVLGRQEDVARELIRSLAGSERQGAIIAARSLGDVVSGPGRADALAVPVGLPLRSMEPAQRTLAERLIDEFLGHLGTELAEAHRARIREGDPGAIQFAWAGPVDPGHAHYFRLHGPRLLVEHDNTQNDANHVHSILRDPGRDFGLDLLGEHYRAGVHAHAP